MKKTNKSKKAQKSTKPHAAKKAAKPAKVVNPLVNFKVDLATKKVFTQNAAKFGMRGNLSEWLRFAGTAFKPSKAQIQKWVA